MVYEYHWKDASRISIPAQAAGERLEALRVKHDGITARVVVDDARRKRSPLHGAFEWDNTVAATEYRLEQARLVLRSIVMVSEKTPDSAPVRAFVCISADGERSYTSLDIALSSPEMRQQVVARALRELDVWRDRYEELDELAEIFAALDTAAA